MSDLKFKYQQINEADAKPVNEAKKIANELKITVELAPYLEELNKSNAHILVTVSENGEQFTNEIVGVNTTKYIPFIKN